MGCPSGPGGTSGGQAASRRGLATSKRRCLVRRAIAVAAFVLVTQIVWWAQPVGLFTALEWVAPGIVWRVPTDAPIVALSFDDGPHSTYTPQVLTILSRHRAHATFFLIGQRAVAHPEVVAAIKAGGHEVGNHYFHEGTALADGRPAFAAKLLRTEHALGLQGPAKLFRPPSGIAWPWQLRQARELGYTCVLGSAYPHDPSHPPVRYIEWIIQKNMAPGAIVILHDGISDPTRGIRALPEILAEGQRRGLRFVTVGELLEASRGGRATRALDRRRQAAPWPGQLRDHAAPFLSRAASTDAIRAR